MNKKQLLIAALATIMSVSVASATNITGADYQGGVYNINPEKINGNVGYRHYENFDLSQGDVAKLIYQGYKSGELRDLSTFINLVNNQVKINGILNAVKADGTGHAIFITPQGMTVGANGVLNAGTLSVITPKADKFSALEADYNNDNFTNINQINKMRNGDNRVPAINNYGGNAPVAINGYVFTRNGADIRGSQVDVTGGIVNGYKPANDFTASNFDGKASAAALFNSLVNTDGIITASSSQIANNGSSVVIKSGAGSDNYIKVSGKVANLANGETVLTNHGDAGLTINGGTIVGNDKVNIYNNNATGALTISSSAKVLAPKSDLSVTSKGGMDVKSGTILSAKDNVEIVNKGNALAFAGTALAGGKIDVVNSGASGATVSGDLGTSAAKADSVRIVNENGKLVFTGNANATKSVSVRNLYDTANGQYGNGLQVDGTIKAGEGVLIQNERGDASLNGLIEVNKAKVENNVENIAIAIHNTGNGKLTTGSNSRITSHDGNIAIKNDATNGMTLAGTITNESGETAINNTAGAMTVNGTITNVGNIGIINRGEGKMDVGATINNTGKLKLANVNGEDFDINGNVTNKDGNFSIYNDNGHLTINKNLTNSNGYLFVYSRKDSDGVTTAATSNIKNTNGDLAIKHNGSGSDAMNRGIDLNGTITKDGANGELAINNYTDDMHVGGTVNTNTKTGIINRNGSEDLNVDATITSIGNKELRIKNEVGTGDMEVAGTINHNGRLNVLANDGTLTLSGNVNNSGSDRSYAIARSQADGINVTEDFNAQSANGMIYILNKVGQDGLQYQGTAKSTNGQVELYNMQGDMVVNGGSLQGNPTVILNKGGKLTVTNAASVTGNTVRIVNKGDQAAEIGSNHKANFREELKK